MKNLTTKTLDLLPEDVERPRYDRTGIATGIVHLGVGGFHRAHQAMYLDRLLERGLAREWGICGVGLMPQDARMRDALLTQDCLYTLVLKHPDGRRERRVIGSMVDYLFAPDAPLDVVEKLASPEVRVVSLTITEGGYNFSPTTGEFDLDNPAIRAELEPGALPTTAFGYVVAALALRRERGLAPFTVLSCDNIQGNGDMARTTFGAFATAVDAELGEWVRTTVQFPNTMVDRITPVTSDEDRADNDAALGLSDLWPVVAEPFEQWVVEDTFSSGRPDWDQVGAQFVADVEPYELMKLRLLNASHQAMCYFGYLSGHRYAHEAMADPLIVELLRRYMDDEATVTLHELPGVDVEQYKATLLERFANPHIRDTLARLCAESSDRIPKWLLPVVRERHARGLASPLSAAIVASWARYAEGVDEHGAPITVVDNLAERVMAAAKRQRDEPIAFIRDETLFGDLATQAEFAEAYATALRMLHERGAQQTLAAVLASAH